MVIRAEVQSVMNEARRTRCLQWISGIPAVPVDVQSILVGCFVSNMELPVLRRVPETIRFQQHLHPQSVMLAAGQKMESHETETEMHKTVAESYWKSQHDRQQTLWSEDGFSQGLAKSRS